MALISWFDCIQLPNIQKYMFCTSKWYIWIPCINNLTRLQITFYQITSNLNYETPPKNTNSFSDFKWFKLQNITVVTDSSTIKNLMKPCSFFYSMKIIPSSCAVALKSHLRWRTNYVWHQTWYDVHWREMHQHNEMWNIKHKTKIWLKYSEFFIFSPLCYFWV